MLGYVFNFLKDKNYIFRDSMRIFQSLVVKVMEEVFNLQTQI